MIITSQLVTKAKDLMVTGAMFATMRGVRIKGEGDAPTRMSAKRVLGTPSRQKGKLFECKTYGYDRLPRGQTISR